jgi:hypothetical protein
MVCPSTLLTRLWITLGAASLATASLAACGGASPSGDARPGLADADPKAPDAGPQPPDAGPDEPDASPPPPGAPQLGAHTLAFHRIGQNIAPISTAAFTSQPTGSTFVVSIGRGDFGAVAAPTDNKQNGAYPILGSAHTYSKWPSSGTATYAITDAKGGAGHVITATTPPNDEVTLAAVEVKNGKTVHAANWVERLAGTAQTVSVTTTGPATLVAFWWGDAGVDGDKTAVPNNGFQVVDSILLAGALVQCAAATKVVNKAGTYDVTWTATPTQGAQLYLVAVQ